MFCPKCGARLAKGSKFCGVCGADLTDHVAASEGSGNGVATGVLTAVQNGAEVIRKKLSTLNKQKVIGVTAVIVAALLLFFLVKGIIGLFAPNYAYVYMSDGT